MWNPALRKIYRFSSPSGSLSPCDPARSGESAGSGRYGFGHFHQRVQCPIDSVGVWKNGRYLRIENYDVAALLNSGVVFAALEFLEIGAIVLRAKFIGFDLSLLHKSVFHDGLQGER